MKEFTDDFQKPFTSIKKRPRQFTAWFIIAIVLGSAGFWLPLFLVWYRGVPVDPIFVQLIEAGTLASFSIVILADGVATTMSVVGGSNVTAAGIRGQAGACALILLILQAVVLCSGLSPHEGDHPKYVLQELFAFLAILLAAYLYCFRYSDWEKSCADVKEKEEEEVDKMKVAAENKKTDGSGVAT